MMTGGGASAGSALTPFHQRERPSPADFIALVTSSLQSDGTVRRSALRSPVAIPATHREGEHAPTTNGRGSMRARLLLAAVRSPQIDAKVDPRSTGRMIACPTMATAARMALAMSHWIVACSDRKGREVKGVHGQLRSGADCLRGRLA